MKYYNQNNYAHVPYPSPSSPKATVESGGCGPTCAAMIASNLTDHTVDPKAMAAYAIKIKARVSGGTDMNVLSKGISKDYGLTLAATSDENVLLKHLKAGGMAIANVGGDRSGYKGVFSNAGHYVVVAGLTSDGKLIVLDPDYYGGKFNKLHRAGKVKVSGNQCICSIAVLGKDAENRNPSYWLFKGKEDKPVATDMKVIVKGKEIPGKIVDGRTWVELRSILEALKYDLIWDEKTRTVIVK